MAVTDDHGRLLTRYPFLGLLEAIEVIASSLSCPILPAASGNVNCSVYLPIPNETIPRPD